MRTGQRSGAIFALFLLRLASIDAVDVRKIPEPLREDLIRYLLATSAKRASSISELTDGTGMAEILMELAADDLRARFEMAAGRGC